MALFESSNPTLSEKRFRDTVITNIPQGQTMTMSGTIQKFGFLLLMMMATSYYSWKEAMNMGENLMGMILGGAIGGLIVAIIIAFKKDWAPYLAPVYALLEGLFIGAVSAMYESMFPGLVMNAVGLTFGVGIAMYLLFTFRIIRATEKFKSVIIAATMGIAVFYFISWIMGLFGFHGLTSIMNDNGMMGIGISLFIVIIAALNLILDFDMIEKASEYGAPKHMEWYGAFGLAVTFVWLYLEILRLLAKLRSRD
jgi:uncharacterized YccA/Bax inhibitor family protein